MQGTDITTHPIHLGLGATAVVEPAFSGDMQWYADYMQRHAADGADARMVVMHSFRESWSSWEMHPEGSEVVLCIAGALTLHQQHPDGTSSTVELEAGRYAINAPGVWHTADIADTATALFITAGKGTQHRPR